jgi:nucleoside 2-deoxyribosyltransferase
MKAGDFIEALERFFIDIIGTVLPGLAMLVGVCYVTGRPLISISEVLLGKNSGYEWALLLGFSYILGHGVISLGSNIIKKWLEQVYRSDRVREALSNNLETRPTPNPEWLLSFVMPERELSERLAQDPIFKAFLSSLFSRIPSLAAEATQVTNYRTWRNLALSITQEHSHLVYRFTFLSLLNLGTATVLISTSLLWIGLLFARSLGATIAVIDFNALLVVMVVVSPLFLERYYYFARIAFQLPISMAVAKLDLQIADPSKKAIGDSTGASVTPQTSGKRVKVYLAGGFQSGWQDKVTQAVPALDYFDPRSHGLKTKAEYTAWDLEAIRRSDCAFAYLESTNPGGYALALEVGFAKALGKFVILVDEKSAIDEQGARYLEMLSEASDVSFKTLQEGIAFLGQYRNLA